MENNLLPVSPMVVQIDSLEGVDDSIIIINPDSQTTGDVICFMPKSVDYEASAKEWRNGRAERIVTLWNAMDGLSNEEVILLRSHFDIIKSHSSNMPEGSTEETL